LNRCAATASSAAKDSPRVAPDIVLPCVDVGAAGGATAAVRDPAMASSSDGEGLHPKVDALVRLVLARSGAQLDRVVELLRHRVASGRKVHGQSYTPEEVEEAVSHYKARAACASTAAAGPGEAAAAPAAAAPARQAEGQVACRGSYMPPAVVAQLLGDDDCAICLEPLRHQAQTIALCGHIFHRICLNRAKSLACPTCRRPVDFDRERVQDLKALVLGVRRGADKDVPSFMRCNVMEFTQRELLASCNSRRSAQPSYELAELVFALDELGREQRQCVLVDGDTVILTT